ncbi:hypothetical protein [Arthrobacter oryzae]|uniref:hypothetical protein n=1 Tax=Arthrobacter oryzae TaxID=409290 RepID=UPI00273B8797|nr:hypothetical protein [Arthrobacter oryzae]WLQ05053.1 hypothetical protein Q8Z05_12930 [Arthrobacter oryzae]
MATYRVTPYKDDHDVLAVFEAQDMNEAVFLGIQHASGATYKLWVQQANGDWVVASREPGRRYGK